MRFVRVVFLCPSDLWLQATSSERESIMLASERDPEGSSDDPGACPGAGPGRSRCSFCDCPVDPGADKKKTQSLLLVDHGLLYVKQPLLLSVFLQGWNPTEYRCTYE